MKTSIATVCLSGGLSEKLQAIAAAGFRGVEIFESDVLAYNGTPADVAREMSDLGLRAITFQPFRVRRTLQQKRDEGERHRGYPL